VWILVKVATDITIFTKRLGQLMKILPVARQNNAKLTVLKEMGFNRNLLGA
jgi:hypothetical protein